IHDTRTRRRVVHLSRQRRELLQAGSRRLDARIEAERKGLRVRLAIYRKAHRVTAWRRPRRSWCVLAAMRHRARRFDLARAARLANGLIAQVPREAMQPRAR